MLATRTMLNPVASATLPVSGAALWLDGSVQTSLFTDAGTTGVSSNGDLIYQWNDLSGNNRHSIQATSGSRPTWVAPAFGKNGLGVVAFNGSQWVGLAYAITGNFTLFVVFKNNDTANGSVIIGKSSGSSNYIFVSSISRIEMNGGSTQQANDARTNGTQWDHSTFKYDGANVTSYSGTSSGTSKAVSSGVFTPDRIGYYSTSSFALDGNIAEVIIYPTALNDTDRATVRNYLSSKWAI